MCTYLTDTLAVSGSAKGPDGWFRITDASVYFDHPVHALADHTLNIDLRRPADGVGARVAVELTAESARALAASILHVLDSAPAAHPTPAAPPAPAAPPPSPLAPPSPLTVTK